MVTWGHNKTPAVNSENRYLPVSLTGARSSVPSGLRPAGHSRGQGRVPCQSSSWQTRSNHHPIVMSVTDSTDSWLDKMSNCWPLEEHHYADDYAVSALFKTDDPPLWSGLFTPFARLAALRENLGHGLNYHEDTLLSQL